MTRSAVKLIPVFVVIPPRTLLLDVAGPLDALRVANRTQQAVEFRVTCISPASAMTTSIGLSVTGMSPLPGALPDDAIIMLVGDVQETIDHAVATELDQEWEREIVGWLEANIRPNHTVVTICSGALFAAKAGLFDNHACTTHYTCCEEMAAIAPAARVVGNRLYVEDANRYSSAGVTAGIDLTLYLIGKLAGHSCAVEVAKYLVVYLRRGGAEPQISPWLDGRNHLHPAIHKVQDAIAANPAKAWTVESLARLAGASNRHLSRLFQEHAGMSVVDYRNRLRIALARELLSQTRLGLEHVADRAGFQSARQLRRVWNRFHSTSPSATRLSLLNSSTILDEGSRLASYDQSRTRAGIG